MVSSLKLKNLGRYKDIALLLWRYGRSDLVSGIGLEEGLSEEGLGEAGATTAESLTDDLEKLGPTFIKLGQMLSTRVDLLPAAYLEALSRLQDDVETVSFEEIEETVRDELGVRISKAFASFDEEPLASASLGQVHRARMRDGREVVVKVQRPGLRQTVIDDFEALSGIAELLDERTEAGRMYGFSSMVEEFRQLLMRELDYRLEAKNLHLFHQNLEQFDGLLVPKPVDDFSTSRVLTMEYVQGIKVDHLSPLVRIDIGGFELADQLFKAYLHQVLVLGLFHADPHPGNVLLTPDHRVALVDLGMVGRIVPSMRRELLELLLAVGDGDGEAATDICLRVGERLGDIDQDKLRQEIHGVLQEHRGASLENLQVGRIVLAVFRIAGRNNLRIPAELSVLGKALLQLDEIGRCLAPDFDPNEAIRRNAGEVLSSQISEGHSLRKLFSTFMEVKDFVEELPGRINRVLDTVGSDDFTLRIDAIREDLLLRGFEKIANRITVGLVLASLIIGASLMMNIETSFRLFGYPGVAMICFLMAAGGAFWLVVAILWKDRETGRR